MPTLMTASASEHSPDHRVRHHPGLRLQRILDGVTEGGGTPIGYYLSDRSWSSKWAIDAKYR